MRTLTGAAAPATRATDFSSGRTRISCIWAGKSWKQDPIRTFATTHESILIYFRKHHRRALPIVPPPVCRVGMALKVGLLRLRLLQKPGDSYAVEHLKMARAAGRTLRTGRVG